MFSLVTQELFKRVIPHQCLGAVWSRRDRDKGKIGKGARSSEASSVAATVEQFNAVSYRVISTILIGSTEPRSQQRARVIAKWIDVAQVRYEFNENNNYDSSRRELVWRG